MNWRFDLEFEIKIQVSLQGMNKMREPLFRVTTEHIKDERISIQGYNRTCKMRSKIKIENYLHVIKDKQLKKRWQVKQVLLIGYQILGG